AAVLLLWALAHPRRHSGNAKQPRYAQGDRQVDGAVRRSSAGNLPRGRHRVTRRHQLPYCAVRSSADGSVAGHELSTNSTTSAKRDAGAHAVQAGHLIQELIEKKFACCSFRVPDIHIRRLVVILGEREKLVPKTRHSLERALRRRRDLAHDTFIEHVGIECDEHSNHPCLLQLAAKLPATITQGNHSVTGTATVPPICV